MKIERTDKFEKFGCIFVGKLAVVDYTGDMASDPRSGQWNSGLTYDYLDRARALVNETYPGQEIEVLLDIPVYVVRLLK